MGLTRIAAAATVAGTVITATALAVLFGWPVGLLTLGLFLVAGGLAALRSQ